VYNKDILADALKKRLDALARTDRKWTPEVLHLLLELSDKPVTKSRIEDLDFLKEATPITGPKLRWKDLVAEDPLLREKSVWKNVDFGAESSDDGFEDSQSELSGLTDPTDNSSVDDGYTRKPQEYIVGDTSKDELQQLRKAQFWRKDPSVNGIKLETVKKSITELQAIREVLFMLSGNPTSLFHIDPESPEHVIPSKDYALKYASNEGLHNVLKDLASQGSAIMVLRFWLRQRQTTPLIQVLENSISERISKFDGELSRLQQKFVAVTGEVVVSLLSVQAELNKSIRPLYRLSHIIKRLGEESYAHGFRYLEMLYNETSTSQMSGEDEMYRYLGSIFFECLQVYLRPIRLWMEEGELGRGDKIFFVSEVADEIEPALLWQSRFKIRKTQAGILHAPDFLHTAAYKIFTTGKSLVVLKRLNRFSSLQTSRKTIEPILDFETVCNPSHLQLAPFPELFSMAFEKWVKSKHQSASSTLRKALYDSCGLQRSLAALSHIYFLEDGTVGAQFANSIFDKLDTLDSSWNDRFTLTELAQSTLGSLPCVLPDHLRTSVRPLPRKYQAVEKCRRSVKTLSIIELQYKLSWPIQIILKPTAIPSYQRVLTFLIQTRRSSHIISRQCIAEDSLNRTSSTDERALYYSTRTRLLWFTQTLYYYLTSVVIEPNYRRMREELRIADDVDTMISVHESYIKSTLDQALLGSKLGLIHKSILKILDQSIKLEDAQAANAALTQESEHQQREMMDLSIAALGIQTPQKPSKLARSFRESTRIRVEESSDEEELMVDLSLLSATYDEDEPETFVETLRKLRAEFDRLVRFVASGLKAIARASGGDESKSWDLFGEMLESGLEFGGTSWK